MIAQEYTQQTYIDTAAWSPARYTEITEDHFNVAIHYYDCAVNLDLEPEYHRYHCMHEDCQYCQGIAAEMNPHSMCHNLIYTLDDYISYDLFLELFPIDEDGFQDTILPYQLHKSYHTSEDNEEDEDEANDSSYDMDEDDTNDYVDIHFGYNPVACEVDVTCFTLAKIDISKLHVIGAGQFGVVLSDDTYAIKIGSIDSYDINHLKYAASKGFAAPVFYYEQNAIVPTYISKTLLSQEILRYGDIVPAEDYITANYDDNDGAINYYTADIAVFGLAIPYIDHSEYANDAMAEEYSVAYALSRICNSHGINFHDCHPYNIGWYNNGLIVLDL